MGRWIHVVRDVQACAETLEAVQAGRLAKQPEYTPITWEQRVDRLAEILRALPRTRALMSSRRSKASDIEVPGAGRGVAGRLGDAQH